MNSRRRAGKRRDSPGYTVRRVALKKIVFPLRKFLRVLVRPVTGSPGQAGFVIQPYRGYGSLKKVFLMGRVFRQQESTFGAREGTLGRILIDMRRRLFRRGVANADLMARFGGTEQQVTTDREGYFRVYLHPVQPPPPDRRWHPMALELLKPAGAVAEGDLFVPPNTARYIVISDIDDTVMYTGVAQKVRMLWRLFAQEAQSRVAFPGVAAFYRALHGGISGMECNPMLYVSRTPWSLYDVLDEFFHLHDIPVGPILFLRDWGMTLRHPFPRRARGHKLALIRNILNLYDGSPIVLLGDSGQHDPEIYAQIVREYPGRILAIYIRNTSRDRRRHREIEALVNEVVSVGSMLLLAADSFAMAEHAVAHNLISPAALGEVLGEQGGSRLKPTRKMNQSATSFEPHRLTETLEQGSKIKPPPNVAVEAEDDKNNRRR